MIHNRKNGNRSALADLVAVCKTSPPFVNFLSFGRIQNKPSSDNNNGGLCHATRSGYSNFQTEVAGNASLASERYV